MKQNFSERNQIVKTENSLQIESMSGGLKNRIWNKFVEYYIQKIDYGSYVTPQFMYDIKEEADKNFFKNMYDSFFKVSNMPAYLNIYEIQREIAQLYLTMAWNNVYDFIEYISQKYHNEEINIEFRKLINEVLKEEKSAYRFINDYIVPIIDEVEIEEIEESLNIEYFGAKRHLSNALELLSDREKPDYPNSIKESISAVEAVAKEITGKETDLASCLKVMDLDLNKQFKTAMTNMYGWTCKEDGIRHGHTGEELKTSFEEAKYMLVTCSAFVNYMIAKKGIE